MDGSLYLSLDFAPYSSSTLPTMHTNVTFPDWLLLSLTQDFTCFMLTSPSLLERLPGNCPSFLLMGFGD